MEFTARLREASDCVAELEERKLRREIKISEEREELRQQRKRAQAFAEGDVRPQGGGKFSRRGAWKRNTRFQKRRTGRRQWGDESDSEDSEVAAGGDCDGGEERQPEVAKEYIDVVVAFGDGDVPIAGAPVVASSQQEPEQQEQ